ncbi:sulfotransferase domain-containing protein [Labrenzia sp. PHM005]|uniref:sulfotransferase domain-containing protein n=1 Tax=Labrenzia sp. PHM005 TaxID=2590016 RepID=UPI0011401E1B|nr:sulfotransferase domain-containing protein [Labrenzia sp. PHM005]QDG75701.1 sulfotransferase domain-containing protein [Labrenzia sp. PHM005]
MENCPIYVGAPTTRCGTTLIQRLISSADNGICYGEFTARRLLALSIFTKTQLQTIEEQMQGQKYDWDKVKSGDVQFWMAALEPPVEYSKGALLSCIEAFCESYQNSAKSIKRDIWATKSPRVSIDNLLVMQSLIPNLNCIYVYRNIVDVVKSQKARGWVKNKRDLILSCKEWVANTQAFLPLTKPENAARTPRLHLVKYEDFVSDLPVGINKLQEFSGLQGIDPEVAKVKVNTFASGSNSDPGNANNYIKPADLSRDEIKNIAKICKSRMNELYPEMADSLSH